MSDLFWPGLHRAGDAFTDAALVAAMTRVEAAWATALEARGVAPAGTASAVAAYRATDADLAVIAEEAELGGNPLIPVLARLRRVADEAVPGAGAAVHTGLTSQDVVDSALVLMAADVVEQVVGCLDAQLAAVDELDHRYGDTPLLGRTLGQPAEVTRLATRLGGWRTDLRDARGLLAGWRAEAPVQLGGAVGDHAAMARALGGDETATARETAAALGLRDAAPWHASRGPITRLGAALVSAATAWGHVANDVVRQSRPEVGELSEPVAAGRGASSAMPHKRNPVLSVLLRRTALNAPLLGAQLQLAAAGSVEERADGAWHAEWAPLRDLARRVLAGAHVASELLGGLEVHPDRMRANAEEAGR